MKHLIHTTALLRHVIRARDFFNWLEEDGDTLIAAADLLGGPDWAERARAVVAVARNSGPVTARVRTLAALSRLLHGGHADGLEAVEAFLFTSLHPDDPRATSAMRCAEALDQGLRAMEALRLSGRIQAWSPKGASRGRSADLCPGDLPRGDDGTGGARGRTVLRRAASPAGFWPLMPICAL